LKIYEIFSHHLGVVVDEPELGPLEEHLLWCANPPDSPTDAIHPAAALWIVRSSNSGHHNAG
jgi:hypothetical protein